jgi:hypothetical protein
MSAHKLQPSSEKTASMTSVFNFPDVRKLVIRGPIEAPDHPFTEGPRSDEEILAEKRRSEPDVKLIGYLNARQVADAMGILVATLEQWEKYGLGPKKTIFEGFSFYEEYEFQKWRTTLS